MVSKSFVTKTGRIGCMRTMAWVLTDEQREWLIKWFPVVENQRLMKASGMTHSTLHRFAQDMGLTKSEKGLRGIMRRQAKRAKKKNEESGYYDSIRGRPPSEASLEGSRRMWQEVRDGIRENPYATLKRKHPRLYKKHCQRRSEERKQLIRSEYLRMKWGLPRKTRLKIVVMQPYTQSQTAHRYNALKRGYILAQDCSEGSGSRYTIYYDEDTKRSAIFERNCIADGFRIREWES